MQITRLLIENLRAIERLELKLADDAGEPRRRVVLIGTNGAGKTTILDAIAHAFKSLGDSWLNLTANALGAADVRNVEDPSLEHAAPLRRGVVALDAVLSEDERRASRLVYPDAPTAGSLRFEVGAGSSPDPFSSDEVDAPQAGSNDVLMGQSSEVDIFGVAQDQVDVPMSFEGPARAALADARSPCILLPADRGVLEPSDDLTLRQIRAFNPSFGCLSRARERFAPIAALLAFASVAKDGEGARSVARMWKVLAKYFPALPQPIPHADGLVLRFRNERGASVPLTALSEGERAILLIFGELAVRSPKAGGLVLIDELEQHLHPRWQRAALEALVALLPSSQFLFTTQSPYLAACAPDDVVELGDWKRDGE
jgi:energy-coupling factor transporter ATP-binding protein EcfA2